MNELLDTPGIVAEYIPLSDEAPVEFARPPLTIRTPDELLAMQFDDSDVILGDRLLADGQPLVIAAQAGAGKSRLLLQFIAAQVSGRMFLNFTTGHAGMRWLVLQTENSNRRLQHDLAKLRVWLGNDWAKLNDLVAIHTVEHDMDGFIALDSPENQSAVAELVERIKPDGIAVDPLNECAAGDLNKDADMRATLTTLSRICKRGNPKRAIVVLHHALTGRAGAAKAMGHDRASFARNSKTLLAWSRGQINVAPIEGSNNDRLVIACGKVSNGREFEPFVVKLNPETMIYEVDPTVDLAAWQADMTGQQQPKDLSPQIVEQVVAELGRTAGPPRKGQIVKELIADTGCGKSAAYDAVDRATRAKAIHYTKATKTYVAR
jgi:hypothetical protein